MEVVPLTAPVTSNRWFAVRWEAVCAVHRLPRVWLMYNSHPMPDSKRTSPVKATVAGNNISCAFSRCSPSGSALLLKAGQLTIRK